MSSAMPWVSWMPCVPLANNPQNVPMMELTAWPPSAGRATTRATLRPRRAASGGGGIESGAFAAEGGGLERGGATGDAGAEHADIGRHPHRRRARWPAHDAGRGRELGLVRIHRWSGCYHPTHHTDYSS